MILRQKYRNQFLFLVPKLKQDCSCSAKKAVYHLFMAIDKQTDRHTKPPQTYIAFFMPRFKGIGSCHKSGTGTIRVGNEQILVITGALIARTVTQRETSCHYRWYMFLLYWIIQSSVHISCSWFFNSHPDLHRTLLVITGTLIARTVTQRAMISHHRW